MARYESQKRTGGADRPERPRLRLALIAAAVQAIFIMSLSFAAIVALNVPASSPLSGAWGVQLICLYLDPTQILGLDQSTTADDFFARFFSIALAYVVASFALGALADSIYARKRRQQPSSMKSEEGC